MASEPLVIYAHRVDPQGVLQVLKRIAADLELEGTPTKWTQAIAYGPKRLLRKRLELRIGHDPSYYLAQNWQRQLSGMAGYFQGFPDIPRKAEILRAIYGFQFSLTLIENTDLDIDGTDPRLAWVYEIVKHLDGVIFTPTTLRDAAGRILISSWGEFDADAMLPQFIPTDDEIRDQLATVTAADDDDEEDEDDEPEPPTAARVVKRALVLTAISQRGLIEDAWKNCDGEQADCERVRRETLEWLRSLEIDEEVEPDEWQVLQRKVGSLETQDMIDSIWRVEGLAVLAWALHLADMPANDELCKPTELATSLGYLETQKSLEVMRNAKLRSPCELEEMNKTLLALHWRVRDFISLRPQAMNFVEFSQNCWFGSFDLTPFRILEDDLAIGDQPISRCDEDLLGRTSSAAMERHLAINWLRWSGIYSETDTST